MTGPKQPEDPMRLSGARWCDDHSRWECTRVRSKGRGECHGSAISGTAVCRMHAGRAAALAKAQGEANLAAWSLAAAGARPAIDPGQAVMQLLVLTAQRVEILAELLRLQIEDQDYEGLIGVTFAAGRDGARVETGEQIRGLARYEADERDRLAKYAKAAHDMGIAERHIELQQAQAQIVVSAARVMLDELGLVPADRDRALRAFLGALGRGPEVVAGEVSA